MGGLYLSYGAGSQGTLNQTAGTVVASFVNMPNGDNYNLNGGTLQTPDFHGGGATLNFGGGTLLMTGTFRANANMSCAIAGGKTAVVDTNGYSLTLYGAISGSGGLVKQGAGTLTLAVANTYAGGTTVNAGTLSVMGSIGAVSVNNGGTLSGTGSVGDVSVNSGGILSPGDSGGSGIGTLNTGNLTFGAGASYYADLANGTPSSDKINVTGTVNLGGANLTLRGGRTVVANEALALIQNDGTDVIGGTFSGFPEGAPLSLAGAVYAVTYQGNRDGTANDMCLASQQAPTVATPATATPSPVTGTTTVLSVLGADDGGEANLTYTWAATAFPAGDDGSDIQRQRHERHQECHSHLQSSRRLHVCGDDHRRHRAKRRLDRQCHCQSNRNHVDGDTWYGNDGSPGRATVQHEHRRPVRHADDGRRGVVPFGQRFDQRDHRPVHRSGIRNRHHYRHVRRRERHRERHGAAAVRLVEVR